LAPRQTSCGAPRTPGRACRFADIQALVFPEDTPPELMRRFEIVENLHRKELSDDEKAVWTAELAALIGDEVNSLTKSDNSKSEKSGRGRPRGLIAATAEASGIDQAAVRKRLKKAADLAGKPIDMNGDLAAQAKEIASAAGAEAATKKAAKEKAGRAYPIRLEVRSYSPA
jgi:ParB-like chromosome segregation protein Spo0J